MESERVYIFKDTLNTTINIAFLWFCLCSKNMWNFFLLNVTFIIFKEKVPAEGRFHVINESPLFV
jgi:hypothetical protein